jgi:uncharacterized membrane protein
MEVIAKQIAHHLSVIVEIIGAIVIGIGLLKFLVGYIPSLTKNNQSDSNTALRIQLGSSLTLALELLLAADILLTAVGPSWDDIGKLAAIATIRTALNYFLEKELHTLEAKHKGHLNENVKS